jgi:hypothetical protein
MDTCVSVSVVLIQQSIEKSCYISACLHLGEIDNTNASNCTYIKNTE